MERMPDVMTDDLPAPSVRRRGRILGLVPPLALTLAVALVARAPAQQAALPDLEANETKALQNEPITPVPLDITTKPARVDLGQRLFGDQRLSGNGDASCTSCHMMSRGGADGLRLSPGMAGYVTTTNTPTVLNVSLSTRLNWDGRNRSLASQVREVIANPQIMNGNWDVIVSRLEQDAEMASRFGAIYPDGVTADNVVDALVEFERSLVTPNSPFDRHLRGEPNAISEQARAGYDLFKSYGCVSCHQGVNVGGNMLQAFGIFGSPAAAGGGPDTPGAARGTGISGSQPVFRVPSLRNVALTAPYFHDGSAETLSDAISIMAVYQLGRTIPPDNIAEIEAFLHALTGEYQGVALGEPR